MSDQTPTVAYRIDDELFDGRYRLGRLLGRGGYARVHEAVDTALERTVALKIIDGDGADPADVARVRSEIRLLASLSHPSLVTLYDAKLAGSPAYLVMELISGPTLSDRIARGSLPAPEVARIGREIAEAFAVIHARGIVHRDVKPSNILIRPAAHTGESPRATLADFGIAALVGVTRVTRADTVIGTAAYLSPEQATGMPAAPASDVYALGLVLLEALTATRPFGARTPHEALAARIVSAPDIPANVPPPWRDVLQRMTALEPGERPDAAGVIMALRTLAGGAAGASSVDAATAILPSATAPTRVLGNGDRTRAVAQPDGIRSSAADDRTRLLSSAPASSTPGRPPSSPPDRDPRRRPRTGVIVASVVALLLAAGVAVSAVALANSGGSADPNLPTLPQPLDQHMDDLWKEVGP
ncbi:serine/threonine protein kinase [Microbacterium sp. SORGH_AS 1204]|uniref:serine/threonine-protein kinase n=1 Tax=Microbacterium sp. SORGH_AS_1204 TaxID=3041785 RepID=UPI00278D1EC1|nr:serine/threonine-protein kinase [Microbacterium sp. SORGH_AS_1204]MDQ1137484.1 serine/threonine protein kinase [Microbacterium sp. SORGH_AS_1204]